MASAYMQLEKAMRRIQAMREAGSSADAVQTEIELARSLWDRVPVTPGAALQWSKDLRSLAIELGFDPDTRAAKSLDAIASPGSDIELARGAYQLVALIDREIRAGVSGIAELEVAAAGKTIVLSGFASDDAAKRRAGAIAGQHAPPSMTIENVLVVKR